MNARWPMLGLFLTLAATSLVACGPAEEELSSEVSIRIDVDVSSDPGRGVANAEIVSRGERLAVTDDAGRATLALRGHEGDAFELAVRCPAGFESPAMPLPVSIRRLSSDSRSPHFDARCAPLQRTVVVGVRAERGPNLPVVYLGRQVARTDASGAAHVVLSVKPGESVTLTLDTKEASSKLLPESPTLTFVAKDADDFVSLDQRFEVPKIVKKPIVKPAGNRPERI